MDRPPPLPSRFARHLPLAGEDRDAAGRGVERYRAAAATTLIAAPLDAFTAVFHRASGITHLLTEPAPEIIAALGDEALSLDALLARLANRYDMADADRAALAARLDELVAAGLVDTAP